MMCAQDNGGQKNMLDVFQTGMHKNDKYFKQKPTHRQTHTHTHSLSRSLGADVRFRGSCLLSQLTKLIQETVETTTVFVFHPQQTVEPGVIVILYTP